jgi:hypothetical protein
MSGAASARSVDHMPGFPLFRSPGSNPTRVHDLKYTLVEMLDYRDVWLDA